MYNDPLISVLMPAYNAEDYIKDAIKSVLAQTYENWELIIIDDWSTDNTPSIISEFVETDNRIKKIFNEKNMGAAHSRNIALNFCCGEYIALLDSDDIWLPSKLEHQLKFIKKAEADIVYCSYGIIDSDGIKCRPDFIVEEKVSFHDMLRKSVMSCSTVMIKRDLLLKYKFREDIYHEDYYLWLQLLKDGHCAVGTSEVLAQYRRLRGSRSDDKLKSACNRWKIYRDALHLPLWDSIKYMTAYAWAGLKKYAL